MARTILFSRQYPSYHPRKGEPTYFVEKFLKAFEKEPWYADRIYEMGKSLGYAYVDDMLNVCDMVTPKYHTIRSGNRWKIGDKFSPRFWSGKPYNSKQIIIGPDIEIKMIWDFEIKNELFLIHDKMCTTESFVVMNLAKNDGLTVKDLLSWFQYPKPFKGQIICWHDIKY